MIPAYYLLVPTSLITIKIFIVSELIHKCFKENFLTLNFKKTHYIHFITKNNHTTKIGYDDKLIPNVSHTKFLGVNIDSTLSWRTHIEQLISKFSTACYVIRSMSHTTLIVVYYSLFHSIINYGLIFWGNSSYCCKIFRMQKKVIRIIMGCRGRDKCRNLFKKLRILPLKSQYLLSLLLLVVNNKDQFIANSENYSINMRQSTNLHLPQAKLARYQKRVYNLGIKIYNSLPSDIKNFSYNLKKFKAVLKTFLYTNCFIH
jgi:hypothetical protein